MQGPQLCLYDALGRVTEVTFPSDLTESYTYDAMNNLLSKTDRKQQTISYGYDALYRLNSKTYPDQTAVGYSYDPLSRLTQVADPTGTYSFTYDNLGRLLGTGTEYSFLSGTLANTYGYDAASNRTSFTDPAGGESTYTYDSLNRLTELANTVSGNFGFGYDDLGRRTSLTRPNGVDTSYSYDNLSRLLSVLHNNGNLPGSTSYTVDAAGNRTSKTALQQADPTPVSVTSNFSYDNIYQLTNVLVGQNQTEKYTYDAVGNRLTSLDPASYTYNSSNELTATSSATYAYDSNGNTTSKTDTSGTTYYTWDYENRLASLTLPGQGGTVYFTYDPMGRRIRRVFGSATTIYAYDGDNITEELDSGGNLVAHYTQGAGIDEPLALAGTGGTYFYHADGLGSITSLTNGSGQLASSYLYDSFGKLTASTGTISNPFQYTGREFDSETGLYYYRARYYDPRLGRFISEDPIGFSGGSNFYAYTGNDPTAFVDSYGLAPGDWWDPRSYDYGSMFTEQNAWATLKDTGTASEAFADALTLGSASRLNDALGAGGMVDRCGIGHKLGSASGIVASIALGGAMGADAAEANAGKKGFDFSHWIPNRLGGPRSVWNGNFVSQKLHYLTDFSRFPAPAGAALRWGPKLAPPLQQILRVPWVYDGLAAGAAYGGAGAAAGRGCACKK